jgi:predicted site-specific integrase-resolvase
MSKTEQGKLLDRKEAAIFLGVSTRTITRWRHQGFLPMPVLVMDRKAYWSRDALENITDKVSHDETK